jgi:hypothetical protein
MESIIQQLGYLGLSPVFVNLSQVLTQPFVHAFQSVVPGFLPYMKSFFSNEPGLVGGMAFVLLSYSFVVLVQNTKKARVVVTNKKPSPIYREGFPSGMNSNKRSGS